MDKRGNLVKPEDVSDWISFPPYEIGIHVTGQRWDLEYGHILICKDGEEYINFGEFTFMLPDVVHGKAHKFPFIRSDNGNFIIFEWSVYYVHNHHISALVDLSKKEFVFVGLGQWIFPQKLLVQDGEFKLVGRDIQTDENNNRTERDNVAIDVPTNFRPIQEWFESIEFSGLELKVADHLQHLIPLYKTVTQLPPDQLGSLSSYIEERVKMQTRMRWWEKKPK